MLCLCINVKILGWIASNQQVSTFFSYNMVISSRIEFQNSNVNMAQNVPVFCISILLACSCLKASKMLCSVCDWSRPESLACDLLWVTSGVTKGHLVQLAQSLAYCSWHIVLCVSVCLFLMKSKVLIILAQYLLHSETAFRAFYSLWKFKSVDMIQPKMKTSICFQIGQWQQQFFWENFSKIRPPASASILEELKCHQLLSQEATLLVCLGEIDSMTGETGFSAAVQRGLPSWAPQQPVLHVEPDKWHP